MQVVIQTIDVLVAVGLAVVGTYVILKVIALFTPLRVTEEQELTGLDLSLHGENAYNTFEAVNSELPVFRPQADLHTIGIIKTTASDVKGV